MLVWTLPTWWERIGFFAVSHAGFSIIHLQVCLHGVVTPSIDPVWQGFHTVPHDWDLQVGLQRG